MISIPKKDNMFYLKVFMCYSREGKPVCVCVCVCMCVCVCVCVSLFQSQSVHCHPSEPKEEERDPEKWVRFICDVWIKSLFSMPVVNCDASCDWLSRGGGGARRVRGASTEQSDGLRLHQPQQCWWDTHTLFILSIFTAWHYSDVFVCVC